MPAVMLASLFILKKRKEARSNASLSLYNKNKVKRRVRSLICFALRFRVLHPHPYGMEPPSCMFNHKRTVPPCSCVHCLTLTPRVSFVSSLVIISFHFWISLLSFAYIFLVWIKSNVRRLLYRSVTEIP